MSGRKTRTRAYKKIRKKNQYKGCKERLKSKCNKLKESCRDVLEDKVTLEKKEAQLIRENGFLKR